MRSFRKYKWGGKIILIYVFSGIVIFLLGLLIGWIGSRNKTKVITMSGAEPTVNCDNIDKIRAENMNVDYLKGEISTLETNQKDKLGG